MRRINARGQQELTQKRTNKRRGMIYIVFGENAQREAARSIQSLRQFCDLPVLVLGDAVEGAEHIPWTGESPYTDTPKGVRFLAGLLKPALYALSPFTQTMYVDADTEFVGDPSFGFKLLERGWQFLIAQAGDRKRWLRDSTFNDQERWDTCLYLDSGIWRQGQVGKEHRAGYLPYYNSGLLFWKRCAEVKRLFVTWAEEWQKYRDWDEQIALQRAVFREPLRLMLLPDTWNTKDETLAKVVLHQYGLGSARAMLPLEGQPRETSADEVTRILAQIGRPVTMDVGFGFNPRPADVYLERYADNRSRMADLKLPNGKPLIWGDMQRLWQFPDKSLDFVHCHHVIEHVEDPISACAELLRVSVAGHLSAPSEKDERDWIKHKDKSYHLWLVKQEGQALHFYPRDDVPGLPVMAEPDKAVDLHWDASVGFYAFLHVKQTPEPVALSKGEAALQAQGHVRAAKAPAPGHVVDLVAFVLGKLRALGVGDVLLESDWYPQEFLRQAKDAGLQVHILGQGEGPACCVVSLMELQKRDSFEEAWRHRDELHRLGNRLLVLVPYKQHFHGGENVLQFDEASLQAPAADTSQTGYLVGVW